LREIDQQAGALCAGLLFRFTPSYAIFMQENRGNVSQEALL